MLTFGQFHAALNEAAKLLTRMQMLRERNRNVRTRLGAAALGGLTYPEMWEALVRANDYDFRLSDESIMAFWRAPRGREIRFAWLESPQQVPTYDDFARQFVADVFQTTSSDESESEEIADIFNEDIRTAFEHEKGAAPLRTSVTPIRYEFKPDDYSAGLHPASHLHIGNRNSIRIACRRVLSPMSFVLFILRQGYPDVWRSLLTDGTARTSRGHIRVALRLVGDECWRDFDTCEMWLE